jgi:hypothetical protein
MKLYKKLIVIFLFVIVIINFKISFLRPEEEFKYDPKGKRDPFVPLIGPGGEYITPFTQIKSVSDLKLEGVIWDPQGESLAIINGKIVKEGDLFDGITIDKIYSDKITISMQDQKFTINLVTEEEERNEEFQMQPDQDIGSF